MNFEELGRVWRDEGGEVLRARTETLSPLRKRVREVEAKVRRRDRLESGAALVLAPAFLFLTWLVASRSMPIAALGAAVLALWCLAIPRRLRRARPSEPDVGRPVAQALAEEGNFLRAQEALLLQVPIWYIAPCLVGALLFVFGIPSAPSYRLKFTVVALAFGVLVTLMNLQTARRVLRPLRLEVEGWLADLDDAPLSGESTDAL